MEIKTKIKDFAKLKKGDLLIWDGSNFIAISTFDLLRPTKEALEANQDKDMIFRSQVFVMVEELKNALNEQRKEVAEILKGLVK